MREVKTRDQLAEVKATKIEEPVVKIVPAIERLEELYKDIKRYGECGIIFYSPEVEKLEKELQAEALLDINNKWGLTM